MARVASHGAPEHIDRLAVGVHAAAGLVGEGDDAVDVGVGIQSVFEVPRHLPRHGGRAVDAGENADVVARCDAPVGTYDALEGRRLGDEFRRRHQLAKGVVALEVAHRHVLHMHVFAGKDVARGEADDLVVAPHRLSLLHFAHRDLVPGGNLALDRDVAFLDQRGARRELDARDDDVVGGIESDGEIGGLQHGPS